MIVVLIHLLYTQTQRGTPWKMSFFVLHISLTKMIQMTRLSFFFFKLMIHCQTLRVTLSLVHLIEDA